MTNIIQVENLTKEFKTRTNKNFFTGMFKPNYVYKKAVDKVSFIVEEGQSLAFLGPNGAGKTTTTKMLTGLMYPSSGTVDVMGFVPQHRKREFLLEIGLVMGNKTGLSWDLTGRQNLEFIQKIYNIDLEVYKKRVKELCEMLEVAEHLEKQVRRLSLGERMKMELIGAIIHQPKVLFLDEPTIGLDITSKKNIRTFLRQIQKELNITLLLTSHDMDDVEQVCDRVIVINHGQKVHDGNLAQLMDQYNSTKFIKVYFEQMPKDLTNFENFASIESIKEDSVTFEVSTEKLAVFLTNVTSNYAIIDLDIVSIPLEEIIEDIFKNSAHLTSVI